MTVISSRFGVELRSSSLYYTLIPTPPQYKNTSDMKTILRTSCFFNSIFHRNLYSKSFHFGSQFNNAQEIFSLSISNAYENYSPLQSDHPTKFLYPSHRSAAKELHLERSPLIADRNQQKALHKSVDATKVEKSGKAGKAAKKQSKKERGEVELNLSSDISEQFPGLNYLSESLKVNMAEKLGGDNLLQSSYLSLEERDQNSVDFMKIIGHSMPLETSSKIIRMIESCCKSAKEGSQGGKNKTSKKNLEEIRAEVRDRKIFMSIKKKLEKQLNNEQHGTVISTSFINNLITSFKEVNPFKITMQEFETCSPQAITADPSKHIDIQIIPENSVLKQCSHSVKLNPLKEEESLKYAYVYELPYDISQGEADELIRHLENAKKVKIDSYMIFPFKNKFDHGIQEVSFRVPENYQDSDSRIEKSYSSVSMDQFAKSKKGGKKVPGLPKPANPEHMALSHATSEKLLSKMKQECFLKYHKSSMVIKFHSTQDKEQVVTPSTRLFGMTYKSLENIRLEEAYQKTTLVLSGIPVGCTSNNLTQFLNKVLSKCQTPIEGSEESYFSTQEVSLQFQYFTDTLKALELLNNLQFEGRKLKAEIKYGSIKKHKGEYVQQSQENEEIVRKIMDVRDQYYRFFDQLDHLEEL